MNRYISGSCSTLSFDLFVFLFDLFTYACSIFVYPVYMHVVLL